MSERAYVPKPELLIDLDQAALVVPPMQKLFVTGNILPGTDLSAASLDHFVHGLSEVAGMNLFGQVQIKTPDHYDQETFNDLGGRPPDDVNVTWMWDDSGGQLYTFPSRAYWTTVDLHTCSEFDELDVLNYLARSMNFRENMRSSAQNHTQNRQWQPYHAEGMLPETPFVSEIADILDVDKTDPAKTILAGDRLETIVYKAVSEGWGDRLASLLSDEQRAQLRAMHSVYEIGVDDAMMDRVLSGDSSDPSDYPFQATYDRLADMEAKAVQLSPKVRVLHIGTGWPGTAIGLYRQNGNPVTCVEIDPVVAAKSKHALEQLGLYGEDKLSVANMGGKDINPNGYGAVIISAMVPNKDKMAILENVRGVTCNVGQIPVILREPVDRARSLFYQPLPTPLDPKIVSQTRPGPADPLRSIVVHTRTSNGISRGYDYGLVDAERRLRQPVLL